MSRRIIMIGSEKPGFPAGTFADGNDIRDWKKRMQIGNTVSMVSADLTDFLSLVRITAPGAWWTDQGLSANEFWNNVKPGGVDLRMTLEDGVTEVPAYGFAFDGIDRDFWIFYRHPGTFSSTSQNKPFLYWGNPNASAYAPGDPMGRHEVFQDYHYYLILDQDPTAAPPQFTDLTGNGNDLTAYGTWAPSDIVSAKMGKGVTIDANRYIRGQVTAEISLNYHFGGWLKSTPSFMCYSNWGTTNQYRWMRALGTSAPYELRADSRNTGSNQAFAPVTNGPWIYSAMSQASDVYGNGAYLFSLVSGGYNGNINDLILGRLRSADTIYWENGQEINTAWRKPGTINVNQYQAESKNQDKPLDFWTPLKIESN